MRAVLFDLQGTLVVAGSLEDWLADAQRASGVQAPDADTVLPVLARVWTLAGERHPDAAWDLDARLHRSAFEQVLVERAGCDAGLAGALYDTMTDQWRPAPGALPLLRALKHAGLRTALVSNTALDVVPGLQRLGLLEHLDAVLTSAEVGVVKPDPAIFELAAARLGVDLDACVHVGDSAVHDGGAAGAGLPGIVVPLRDGVPRLDLVAPLLGVRLDGARPPSWPMPPSVPAGMVLELSRARVRPGREQRARAWMAMLNDRLAECEATLSVERSAVEAWFLDEDAGGTWIWHVGLAGEGGAPFDETSALDVDHLAFAREVMASGWEELEPMFLLVPPHIRAAIERWGRTGSA